jgi:uncharacterized protein (TIRG00374 family)
MGEPAPGRRRRVQTEPRDGRGDAAAPRDPRGQAGRITWSRFVRYGALVAVTGVSIYLLLPSLLGVFMSWPSLKHAHWYFVAVVLVSEAASFVCMWDLDRILLGTRTWFPVATAQLAGNAVGRILPGGGATATAFSVSMLRRAGFDGGEATVALATSTGLQLATALALPVLALPAIVGGASMAHDLAAAAYLGLAALGFLVAAGWTALRCDRPVRLAGRVLQWLLNHTVRREDPLTGLPETLLTDRNSIRSLLGAHWKRATLSAAGRTGFDYLTLLAALAAVGASPQPSLVLLGYTGAALLALVPFTPGGLGFVEGGLVGLLTLAGVPGKGALAATLLYRLASYWLPLPAGGIAYLLFRRRYGRVGLPEEGGRGHADNGGARPVRVRRR